MPVVCGWDDDAFFAVVTVSGNDDAFFACEKQLVSFSETYSIHLSDIKS